MNLLTSSNRKTVKGEKFGYMTYILHLSPADRSGYQTCPKASAGCKKMCLNESGMGFSNRVQNARIEKTKYFFENREAFMNDLVREVSNKIKGAVKKNAIPAFRLNGTSDIAWEKIRCVKGGIEYRNIMEAFPNIQFYDYTKIAGRKNLPSNYHMTFSRSENNDLDVRLAISNNMNVAVVFSTLPETYLNRKVVNGDLSDLRFLDASNVIVGLTPKGRGRHDKSGFVLQTC